MPSEVKKVAAFAPGTRVSLTDQPGREARITAVELHESGVVRYEVVWWVNGSRNSAWVHDSEVSGADGMVQIGFRAD